jgi:hypothetical protein
MSNMATRIADHRRLRQQRDGTDDDRTVDELSRALDVVTWSFIDQPPATVAEAAALLLYAREAAPWPDNRGYHDDGADVDWMRALVGAVGAALKKQAS